MDYEKIGKFIKKLREDRKWSQEALADKLFCDRTKINKIENGKRYIKIDDLILLSEIFELSMEELISGEKQDKNNKSRLEITFKEYLKAQNTRIKKLRIVIISLIIIMLLCFSLLAITYFFQNYKSIRIYRFYGKSENYEVNDGLLILSKDKIYLKIDAIIPEVEEVSIYSECYNEEKLIYRGDPNVILHDRYGYEAYISYKDFINSKQKIFLVIDEERIDLTFKEDFTNDKLIYRKNKKIGEGGSNISPSLIPRKIKDNFNCEGDSCHLELKDENLIYSNETLFVTTKRNYYLYDIENKLFEYQDLENSERNFIVTVLDDDITCVSGNCKESRKVYDKFYNYYILKYLD